MLDHLGFLTALAGEMAGILRARDRLSVLVTAVKIERRAPSAAAQASTSRPSRGSRQVIESLFLNAFHLVARLPFR
jgi:hypothetical protein